MSGSPHSNERRVLTRRPVAKWLLGRMDHASSGKDSHPSAGQPFGYKTELKGPFEKARARQVLRTVVTRGPFRKHSDLNKVELWCVALSLQGRSPWTLCLCSTIVDRSPTHLPVLYPKQRGGTRRYELMRAYRV